MKSFSVFIILLFSFLISCQKKSHQRPNIVLIVADDLGYSDLGCFGSEIATPNIDALAHLGQLFTNFYTAATCSPTRAMLLSGTDNHIAGLGNMAERSATIPSQQGHPGYEGYLNQRVVCVAQLLKDKGYHTYISGKWHLGLTPEQSPTAHGFERSFALLDAYANHFVPNIKVNPFWEDGHYARYPEGKYSTDLYTDKSLGFIKAGRKDGQPFLLYASYTAPHWPLQAPLEYIDKYQGNYDIGYDSLRIRRFHALKEKGLVAPEIKLPELPRVKGDLYSISNRPLLRWNELNKKEQHLEARKMEIYAGMIANLDFNIGRLIQYLKEIGEYDNTVFVFMSDNGADVFDLNETPNAQDPYPYMGTVNSFIAYGPQWAHASSAVNRLYKGYSSEGGIHCPLIIKMPFQNERKVNSKAFTTVMDIAPTFLEIAGGQYPSLYEGRPLAPYQGESMLPLLTNQKDHVHDENYVMGWELFGRCALRKGKWKIYKIEPPFGKGAFELFNLEEDPTESNDLSAKFPEIYKDMLNHWNDYFKKNGVILLQE